MEYAEFCCWYDKTDIYLALAFKFDFQIYYVAKEPPPSIILILKEFGTPHGKKFLNIYHFILSAKKVWM
jgi:hypothetical protein